MNAERMPLLNHGIFRNDSNDLENAIEEQNEEIDDFLFTPIVNGGTSFSISKSVG